VNLTFYLDSIPPILIITSPKDSPYYTNKNGVNIKGRTELGARVFLNGQELQIYDLQFTIRVEVFIGMNNFTVSARDLAGNVASMNITIVVDKTPPLLNISRPFDAYSKTRDDYYIVTGFTDPGATVSINGISYMVGSDGHFSAKRSLAVGANRLVITAKDQAGNPKSTERVIMRERPASDLTGTYIGYAAIGITVALLVCSVLIFMWRTGRFKKFNEWRQKRKDIEDKERMSEGADEKDLPPKLTGTTKATSSAEEPVAIPGTSGGPSYDDDVDASSADDDEDIPEMEELSESEAKEGSE